MTAYFAGKPDPAIAAERVAFGTSGHRGSAFNKAFNEDHIVAVSQAVADHRRAAGVTGPLYIGIDTHALAEPALVSAVEVFAANGVDIMGAPGGLVSAAHGPEDVARTLEAFRVSVKWMKAEGDIRG
mgnify:CR=1 FL=1